MRKSVTNLSFQDVFELSELVKENSHDLFSVEEISQKLVKILWDVFVDDNGEHEFPLCRIFKSCFFDELPPEIKKHTPERKGEQVPAKNQYLVLMGTYGDRDEWQFRTQSKNHQVIPLYDPHIIEDLPMMSALFKQIGFQFPVSSQSDASIQLSNQDKDFGVFLVHDAKGSKLIPAQVDFVEPFGIKSAIGFGGKFSNNNIFAAIVFSKKTISDETAKMFYCLAPAFKYVQIESEIKGNIFSSNVKVPESISKELEISIHIEKERTISDELSRVNLGLRNLTGKLSESNRVLKKENVERQRAEDELKRHREHLEELVGQSTADLLAANDQLRKLSRAAEQSPSSIIITDRAGKIEYVNPKFTQLSGYAFNEVVGKNPKIWKSGSIPAEVYEVLWKTISSGKEWRGEFYNRKKDGSCYWGASAISGIKDAQGNITHYISSMEDTTERKNMEAALHKTRQLLEQAIQIGGIGIWEWKPQDNVLIWHDSMYDLYHIDRKDFSGTYEAWRSSLHPDDLEHAEREVQITLNGKETYDTAFRICWPNGEIRHIKAYAHIDYDDKGEAVRMVGVNLDITEPKLMEDKLKNSIAEKEVLLREINHRAKNNLQLMSSLIKMQSRGAQDEPKYYGFLQNLRNRIIAMNIVHNQIFEFTDLVKIDMHRYITDLTANLKNSFGEIAKSVEFEVETNAIFFDIDKCSPCGLIINELVSNSMKYAFPPGQNGKIMVILQNADNGRVELIVRDDGIGMSETVDIHDIKSLGMRLVTSLAENQLHGKIELKRNHGTEFKISFDSSSDIPPK